MVGKFTHVRQQYNLFEKMQQSLTLVRKNHYTMPILQQSDKLAARSKDNGIISFDVCSIVW